MIQVGAGVVDYDYRGEVGVVLFNHGPEDFEVAVGDRVAQLLLEEISMAPCTEVESLDDTARGAGGFGSTGMAEPVGSILQPSKRAKTEDGSVTTPMKVIESASEVAELREELKALREQVAALAAGAAAQRGA
mmetsp:Transcript_75576/g.216395  ORF Transcript_75576/g.216395 Transcript_75576/m.216395 type:complete len:133 (+) Transcript_75576:1-399(+)